MKVRFDSTVFLKHYVICILVDYNEEAKYSGVYGVRDFGYSPIELDFEFIRPTESEIYFERGGSDGQFWCSNITAANFSSDFGDEVMLEKFSNVGASIHTELIFTYNNEKCSPSVGVPAVLPHLATSGLGG